MAVQVAALFSPTVLLTSVSAIYTVTAQPSSLVLAGARVRLANTTITATSFTAYAVPSGGSPGYQWQMQQGTNAIMNNASAMGGVNSGNTLKALQTYGQGLANQDYYNAANLYTNQQQNTLGALQSLTGVGQTAAGAASGVAIQGGNTRAANAVAQGQISSNLVNGLTIGSGSNSLQSLYSSLFGNNGSGYVGSPTGAGNNGVPY